MADQFLIYVEGIEGLKELEQAPAKIIESARIAVNDTARWARTRAAEAVLRETAFPASYVAPRNGRLAVKNFASNDTLEAIISAQRRATSLSRFVQGPITTGGAKKRAGLRVRVDPAKGVRLMKHAFLIKLRGDSIDAKGNVGVAVRTKDGRPPPGYKPTKIAENLFLLAGPSVAQNLYSEKNRGGVFTDISPAILKRMQDEFLKQTGLRGL